MADDKSPVPSQQKGGRRGSYLLGRRKDKQPAISKSSFHDFFIQYMFNRAREKNKPKGHHLGHNSHPSHEIKQPGLDFISSLPDVILQHILCFLPIKFVIRISLLSKQWRYVWCDTPSLSLDGDTRQAASMIITLIQSYTAPKLMNLYLYNCADVGSSYVNKCIKFAMSRNVENMLFDNFFYINCSVSLTSLKKLSLYRCKIPDESIAKILSGCKELTLLDLSNNPCLRTLQVSYNEEASSRGPTKIVAPYIHSFKLLKSKPLCTLLNVSSLTEAKLDTFLCTMKGADSAQFIRPMVLNMLEKLRNVEKLTLGESYLQILSLAEIHGDPFPIFKVKALNLETDISQYVIRGIQRMLQNSPELKKITLHLGTCNNIISKTDLDTYVTNLNNPDQSWKTKFGWNKKRSLVKLRHVVAFVKLMLENAVALEMLVLRFQDRYCQFKEMVPTLSNENNVSIVLQAVEN